VSTPFNTTFEKPEGVANLTIHQRPNPRLVPPDSVVHRNLFHGRPLDGETGLYYFRNRYYDPELGRFTSVDPLGYGDGPSMYGFAMNGPVNGRDPLGLCVGALGRTTFCRGVNEMVTGGDSVIFRTAKEHGIRASVDKAKREAIRVVNGLALSPRVRIQTFQSLEHGQINPIVGLVLHQTGAETSRATLNHYRTSQVGAQFLIAENGQLIQTAALDQVTWHVGRLKSRCLESGRFCALPIEPTTEWIFLLDDFVGLTNAETAEQGGHRALHRFEMGKVYPLRYPSNLDSIGIEIVGAARDPATGAAPFWSDRAVYDDLTNDQTESLRWLVHQLRRVFGLSDDDIFLHPDISRKNPTEAQSADWR
jgi:RHS repeat-associated protein